MRELQSKIKQSGTLYLDKVYIAVVHILYCALLSMCCICCTYIVLLVKDKELVESC